MQNLNIDNIIAKKQILKVGELTQKQIDVLELDVKPKNIKFAYDRIYHLQKHKADFSDEKTYIDTLTNIPTIIQCPDYIGYNKKNNSIEYIKRFNDLTLIAVRLKPKGDLFLRSIYPISDIKLKN